MELRHLRYFLAVAEERNFTRAAARLKVAQPAVSSQVRDLEEELGVRLLERDSHHVALTAAGEVFGEGARRLLEDLEATRRRAGQAGRGETGRLAIGFFGSQGHEWIPQVFRKFRKKFGTVELSLTEIPPSEQFEALLGKRLDVGFIGAVFGRAPAGLEVEVVTEEPAVVGVPSEHRLVRGRQRQQSSQEASARGMPSGASAPLGMAHGRVQGTVALRELREEGFVLTSRQNSPMYREWLGRRCEAAGFVPRVVQEVDRARTCLQYVAAGFGISIFAEYISHLPAPGVRFLAFKPVEPNIRFGVAWRRGGRGELVGHFLEEVRAVAKMQRGASIKPRRHDDTMGNHG